jgi:hypothetical protein
LDIAAIHIHGPQSHLTFVNARKQEALAVRRPGDVLQEIAELADTLNRGGLFLFLAGAGYFKKQCQRNHNAEMRGFYSQSKPPATMVAYGLSTKQ